MNTVGNYPALEAGTADWVSPFKHRAVAAASIQGSLTTASKSVGLAIVADRLIWISLRAAEAITGMTVRTRCTAVGRPLAGNFNQQSADAENYTSSQFTNADDLRKTLDVGEGKFQRPVDQPVDQQAMPGRIDERDTRVMHLEVQVGRRDGAGEIL